MGFYKRGSYLSSGQAEEILEGALTLLEQVGIAVPDAALQERLRKAGLKQNNNRICIDRTPALAYLATLRGQEANVEYPPENRRLYGKIGIYSSSCQLPGRHDSVPFDSASLAACARFCQVCGEAYDFPANAPGYAADAPRALESLHRYMIDALYCASPDPEPSSLLSARYILEMAEVLGAPVSRLPAFPPSPLTLAGSSVEMVVENAGRLQGAYVYSMSLMGINTPMAVSQGFAVNLAEVLGCAFLLHELTGLPVEIRPNLIPFDMRACNLSFGSPEKFMLELAAADLYGHLLDCRRPYRSTNVHTHAKVCGVQSAFEKGSLMAMGAQYGAGMFYCVGTLALDEVFSPVQLIMDMEILRQLEACTAPLAVEAIPEGFADAVAAHLKDGFMAADLTLENYGLIQPSGIFDRWNVGQWLNGGAKNALDKAEQLASDLMKRDAGYRLDEEKARAIRAIYSRAEQELRG